ncbi:hypothetical protein BZA05DRAFT_194191 [Tricharina praecox]|uniref:uncharacterized protein n=1 Tax=Tricharina praecox TaxID=43433 RepID=UPI00221E74D3|nr:uncharacterized protein BZA05DRAFT_194191 [Tricharina praecox]KAI5842375.1 hypothetical protein BZA05DRAFT_194191 [Tricharina praecox]
MEIYIRTTGEGRKPEHTHEHTNARRQARVSFPPSLPRPTQCLGRWRWTLLLLHWLQMGVWISNVPLIRGCGSYLGRCMGMGLGVGVDVGMGFRSVGVRETFYSTYIDPPEARIRIRAGSAVSKSVATRDPGVHLGDLEAGGENETFDIQSGQGGRVTTRYIVSSWG